MLTHEQALTLVLRCLASLGRELGKPELEQANEQTHLLGDTSPLDSLALVKLIVDLEEDVRVATGKSVILAEENTMDFRTSPFRRVDLLAEYIVEVTSK
jgi:acyl carrier protein